MPDPVVAALDEACRERPTAEKWVLLHSRALGAVLGERLAREGRPWLNLRFTTPLALARDLSAPALAGRGLAPMHPAMAPALAGSLLHGTLGRGRPYFRRLAGYPGMARALASALRQLRMAGLRASGIDPGAFVSRDKGLEMRALLEAYEEELARRRLVDDAGILEAACEAPPPPASLVLHLPVPPWTALEARLLERLPGEKRILPLLAPAGLEAPPRIPAGALRPPGEGTSRLAWLFSPGGAAGRAVDFDLFHAAGHDAELQEALRRLLGEGLAFDQVEIALASPKPYTGLLRDACARLGIPLTLAEGLPLTHTRPGRALLGFCRWAGEGFPSERLVRLLQSGDIDTGLDEGPTAAQAARMLLAATPSGAGRGAAPQALRQQAFRQEGRSAEANRVGDAEAARRGLAEADRLRRLARALTDLASLLPDGEAVDPPSVFRACLAFLSRHVRRSGTEDAGALAAVEEALSALAEVRAPRAPLGRLLQQVEELLEGLSGGASTPKPGHLHAAPLLEAGWAGRRRTFVLGLDQGALPGTAREHPVLLDSELERLGGGFATGAWRASETLFLGASRLGSLEGRVTLSCATRDLREDRELYPSSALLQAHRLGSGRLEDGYKGLLEALGDPVTRIPASPGLALDEAGWWLASLRDADPAARRGVLAAFPALARRPAHGLVPSAAGEADPRTNGRPISASALEELARCPFRFFLHRVLRLDPPPRASEPDLWLDPLTRGGLLHEIFAEFLRQLRDEGARPDPASHALRLRRMGEDALRKVSEVLPPPSRRSGEEETRGLLEDLEAFLMGEARAPGRTPVGLEVAFGQPEDPREALASADPVPLDLGEGMRFLLKGQIDRIDRIGPGPRHEVIDYKTGRLWSRERRRARYDGGTQLQHALYALAAGALLRRRDPGALVADSQYLFPGRAGHGARIQRGAPEPGGLRGLLTDLLAQPAAGRFPHAANEGTCRTCEFRSACGDAPWAEGERQRQDPALDPLLRAENTR